MSHTLFSVFFFSSLFQFCAIISSTSYRVMDAPNTLFQPLTIPRDSEGYVKSFTLSSYDCPEAEEARAFFKEYGFVVIANVFTPEQCATTISDIWDVIESFNPKIGSK